MFTVLLVDDEQAELDTLSQSVNWPQFGVGQVLCAQDGESALSLMASDHVDLLITDIRMPQMDGLQLIEHVRKLHPETHCILLTAYEQFEYARAAIRLGVENYLLKPLNITELEETISHAMDNLYVNRQSSEILFAENVLVRWLHNLIGEEELFERASLLDFNPYLPRYLVICVRKHGQEIIRDYCMQVKELLHPMYEVYFVWDQYSDYHVFILGGRELDTEQIRQVLLQAAAPFPSAQHLTIAIGPIVSHSQDMVRSFQSADRMLNQFPDASELTVLTGESESAGYDAELTASWIQRAFSASTPEERHQTAVDQLENQRQRVIPLDDQYSRILQGLTLLYHRLQPNDPDRRFRLLTNFRRVAPFESRDDFVTAVLDAMDYCYLQIQHDLKELSPVIHMAIDYVSKHYNEPISLRDFCTHAKISMPYFGHLFKNETGVFFNTYLMQYRICAATELLRDTDLKIYEIAERVGFSSTSYFISCFRQQTGLSPIKYRMQEQKIE